MPVKLEFFTNPQRSFSNRKSKNFRFCLTVCGINYFNQWNKNQKVCFYALAHRVYAMDIIPYNKKEPFRKDVVITSVKSNYLSMKTNKIFAILFVAAILVASCKEEDTGTPRQITKTYTYNQNIRGSEGVKGELSLANLNLTDVIGTVPASNFKNAEMQLADSYLEITGLNEIEKPDTVEIVLEDFTIKVGARQGVNLGDCSTDPQGINEFASDVEQSTNTIIGLIQNIFTDVTSGSKSAQITVSFTPSVAITSSDNVQLKISFGGTYYYVVFE